jgi:septal ring factor EnvC (AmiA/AmiB activator)
MRHLRALAVAVFAAALVTAAGCGQENGTPVANQADAAKAAQMQKDLDQAKQDLQAAQTELAAKSGELKAKTMEAENLQKQLDVANRKLAEITKTVQDAMKLAAPPAMPSPK